MNCHCHSVCLFVDMWSFMAIPISRQHTEREQHNLPSHAFSIHSANVFLALSHVTSPVIIAMHPLPTSTHPFPTQRFIIYFAEFSLNLFHPSKSSQPPSLSLRHWYPSLRHSYHPTACNPPVDHKPITIDQSCSLIHLD